MKKINVGKFAYINFQTLGSLCTVGYIRNEKALKAVGENIKRLRLEKGYSLREMGDLCDMESSQIHRVEQGKINTSVSVLFKIAEVLQIKPSNLLEIE